MHRNFRHSGDIKNLLGRPVFQDQLNVLKEEGGDQLELIEDLIKDPTWVRVNHWCSSTCL